MNILNYAAGYDTGGQSIRYKQAFTRLTDHTYRSCVNRHSYIQYPTDASPHEARTLAARADIVHTNNRIPGFRDRHGRANMIGVGKPAVVHYHGTRFRRNPADHIRELSRIGATGLCSTLDLWLLAPDDLMWMPAVYNLDWLAKFRQPNPTPILRIGHSPTARAIKSTEHLLAAVERLAEHHPVQLVLGERMTWNRVLRMKGTVDVYFDQVILGYGNNAIEAWGMGIPVIAGAADDTLTEMNSRFGTLPFLAATESTIYEALVAMCDPETRAYWAEVGAAHARSWHSEEAVVPMLEAVYTDVLAHH